jgi:tRNA dimethylallyltransferase
MDLKSRPRLIILLGPTGVGKSKLAIEIVQQFGGEIISADSMQVYRYMDIGTAKPSQEDRKKVPHHMIDLVNPDQNFNAALYRSIGRKKIDELYKNGKLIWVVGGTGLYIKALTQGIFNHPKIPLELRERLKKEAEEKGRDYLYNRLMEVDPKTASRIHPRDLFRIIRALEVYESTGIPISFYREQHSFGDKPYRTLKIGLQLPREELYKRIDKRVDRMIELGFLEEVRHLLEMGYHEGLKPMRSLGYKQLVQFLLKKINWDKAIREIKFETHHFAKRQLTWFKADPEIHWWDISKDQKEIIGEIKSFLKEENKW